MLDLPIAYLIIAPAMAAFDASLEESSRVCGASTGKTIFRITLPVLRPAILAAFVLCVIRGLASFAVPSVIGMPGRIYVLATHLYQMVSTGFAADYGKAAAVGMSVMVASIILIYLYRYLTSAGDKYVTIAGRGYKPTIIQLARLEDPALSHSRCSVIRSYRPAGDRPRVYLSGAVFHGAQCPGLFDDGAEALDRGAQ